MPSPGRRAHKGYLWVSFFSYLLPLPYILLLGTRIQIFQCPFPLNCMNLFLKSPASPTMIETLRKEGEIVIEVTVKQLYILHNSETPSLGELMDEWFVTYQGRGHAYRDGSHVGGADTVLEVKNLSDGGKIVPLQEKQKLIDKHLPDLKLMIGKNGLKIVPV